MLPQSLAVCRLGPREEVPAWATRTSLFSVTRTFDELSVVCPESNVPAGVTCSRGWRALKLEGPFDLDQTGILVSVAAPLAEVGISIFALSTYDTDYVLVRGFQLEEAVMVLSQCGHTIRR